MKKTTRTASAKPPSSRKPVRAQQRTRKAGTKKPAVRRIASQQPERDTRRSRLQRLLFDSIAHMDEEGVVFLLRQAHILSSNANAMRINREIEAFERARGPAPEPEEEPTGTASIEPAPDGKSYFLTIGTARKALTRAELGAIVRICIGAVDREVGVRNLFRSLGQERGDILVDAKISGPTNPHLKALYDKVMEMARQT